MNQRERGIVDPNIHFYAAFLHRRDLAVKVAEDDGHLALPLIERRINQVHVRF